jgi:hypothetical protein
MTVFITLTLAGANVGPFNLYSNLDGYTTAFESNVSRDDLIAGYPSDLVPDGTTSIRLLSTGECNNYFDIPLPSYNCVLYTIEAHEGIIHTVEYIPCGEIGTILLEVGPEDSGVRICASVPLISDNYPEYTVTGSSCNTTTTTTTITPTTTTSTTVA